MFAVETTIPQRGCSDRCGSTRALAQRTAGADGDRDDDVGRLGVVCVVLMLVLLGEFGGVARQCGRAGVAELGVDPTTFARRWCLRSNPA